MRKWLPELIVLVAFAASMVVYSRLPDQLPVHWDVDGNPNGWAPQPFGAFLAPLVLLVIAVFRRFAPDLDARQANYPKFWHSLESIYITILLLGLVMHIASLALALGYPVPMRRLLTASLGLFSFGIGNVWPRLRMNSFVGIRNFATLSDDRIWAKTHRVGGYLFFIAGTLMLAAAVAGSQVLTRIAMVGFVGAFLGTILYSTYIVEP